MEQTNKKIKDLLNKNNMTQKELAEKLQITPATLSRNLNEINSMRADILIKIAKVFNVSADYLLGIKDDTNKIDTKRSLFVSPHQNTKEFKKIISIIDSLDFKELNLVLGILIAVVGKEVKEEII